jgi:Tfp pilus assembly protein PilO
MKASNRLIVAILAVAALAIAFWMLILSPKREEADELSAKAAQLQIALGEARGKAAEAAAAKRKFPADYRHLVVLGQAAPAGDETSSLLIEVSSIAEKSKVDFAGVQLEGSGETSVPVASPTESAPATPATGVPGAVPAAATVPPTEAAASVLPLGAKIGAAGLGVMPYGLTFSGNFFEIANFIKGIDSLVHSGDRTATVNGRLVTINGFSLSRDEVEGESNQLTANFAVTTYITPPELGLTAGATPASPAPVTTAAGAAQAASTTTTTGEGPSNPTETVEPG